MIVVTQTHVQKVFALFFELSQGALLCIYVDYDYYAYWRYLSKILRVKPIDERLMEEWKAKHWRLIEYVVSSKLKLD